MSWTTILTLILLGALSTLASVIFSIAGRHAVSDRAAIIAFSTAIGLIALAIVLYGVAYSNWFLRLQN